MSLRLGLCIPKGKKTRIGLPGRIKHLCQEANIKIIEVEIGGSMEKQGPFHVLLHKALDYHNENEAEEAHQKINKLISYSAQHRDMIVIDDFSWCIKLTNRKYMVELIKSCEFALNGIKVFLPKTLQIKENMSLSEVKRTVERNQLKFPVVAKPYSAYFDNGAHDMSLIFSSEGIAKLRKPCLIQEFCDHRGVLYKVFVVGTKFNICERPSIKDLGCVESATTISFDSHRVSKTGQPFLKGVHASDPNKRQWRNCDEVSSLLDYTVVESIISKIHEHTGLYLFGFDVLIEKGTGNYALIDLNQFPSYSGIDEEHFPRNLVSLLKCFSASS